MGLKRVLVIDDEWNLRNLIKIYLNESSFHIKEAENGLEGLRLIEKEPFDLVILDIMLPEIDGWEVCRRIRLLSDVPIFMLTARGSISDRVKGLRMGADDYLPKPFASEELIARIEALLRRGNLKEMKNNNTENIECGPLWLNSESRICQMNQVDLNLTQKEFDLLLLMARHPKKVFTREHLLDVIWENALERDERTVDTHIKNIREKIKRKSSTFNPIKTVWGVGYKIDYVEIS
jgi:two-component system, OmpR family, response regulator ResD